MTLGAALRHARLCMGLSQEQLGAVVSTSRVSINRWERHGLQPSPLSKGNLLYWARTLPPFAGTRLRIALGDALPAPPAPEDVRRALDDAVYRGAEALDVKARALRGAVDGVLAVIESSGVSVQEARALLAPRG